MDVDDASVGKRIAYLRSIQHPEGGFGTLMQEIAPDEFIGQRICFSAAVRTESLTNWAGLWMRVDGARARSPLAFDNMYDRRITGSTDWSRYAVVLEVADEATNIGFGVLLNGVGSLWIAELAFEAVGRDIPTTGRKHRKPVNLDFSEPETAPAASQRTVEPPARLRE